MVITIFLGSCLAVRDKKAMYSAEEVPLEAGYHYRASIYQNNIDCLLGSFLRIGLKWVDIRHKILFLHAKSAESQLSVKKLI